MNEFTFPVSDNVKLTFQKKILEWAKQNLIEYPWRKNRTPYSILISEILLIRTKAIQVEPVFSEFMEKYPSLEHFFKIKLRDAEELIESLGLLFRATVLVEISSQIQSEFNNLIPDNVSDLKTLKGIGDYGANAVLCFGFGKKSPLVDSNFIRLYQRIFNIVSKTKTAKTDKFLWGFANHMLPDKKYIDFNYAMLDLGGNICLPRNPNCEICPVRSECRYNGKQK